MTGEEGGSEWQGKRAVRNDRGGGDSELAGKGWRNDRGGAVRNDGLLKDPGFVRLFSVIPTHAPALVAAMGRSYGVSERKPRFFGKKFGHPSFDSLHFLTK
jgi:hypothetical protein